MDYRTYTAFIETRPLAIDFSTFDRLVRGEMRESQYTEAKALEQAAA